MKVCELMNLWAFLHYYKWIIVSLALIVAILTLILAKRRRKYWEEIKNAQYITVDEDIEEKPCCNELNYNENEAVSKKTIKKIIISVVVLLVSFACVFAITSVVVYKDCFGYKEDANMIDDYFEDITKIHVLNKVKENYSYFYTDSFIEQIKVISEYKYTLVPRDEAIAIIRDKSAENTAYQVHLYIVSKTADTDKNIHNIVYFEYEYKFFALVLSYQRENNYLDDNATLYSIDCNQFPQEFNEETFKYNNLISNLNDSALRRALKKGTDVAGAVVVAELCMILIIVIIMYTKKHKK